LVDAAGVNSEKKHLFSTIYWYPILKTLVSIVALLKESATLKIQIQYAQKHERKP